MNFSEEEKETLINNEFDYSNIVPRADYIGVLVQYCEGVYNQLLKSMELDRQKNERLKPEYRKYDFEKSYGDDFEVLVYSKNFSKLSCKSYNTYIEAVNNGQLNEVNSLEIRMNIFFKRGSWNNLKVHDNKFVISFKPYAIKFSRKSNFNDPNIAQVENEINGILQRFPQANSIFCTK